MLSDEVRKSSADADTSFNLLHIEDADDVEEVSFRESGNGESITYEAESFSIYTVFSLGEWHDNRKVVYASTEKKLQEALDSDTIIMLEGKSYDTVLTIYEKENLSIYGMDGSKINGIEIIGRDNIGIYNLAVVGGLSSRECAVYIRETLINKEPQRFLVCIYKIF